MPKMKRVSDAELSLLCQKCTELATDLKALTDRLVEGKHEHIKHRRLKANCVVNVSIAFRDLANWLESNA